MRIGIFTDTYTPEINGVVTSVVTLQKVLEKHGHKVYIITSKKGFLHSQQEGNVFRMPGLELKWLYGYILTTPYHFTVRDAVAKMDLDVIHIQQEFGVGTFGRICARSLQIPVVYTYHTMYEDYTNYVNKFNLGSVEKISKKTVITLSKMLCQSSTGIIAPSKKTKEALLRYGVKRPIQIVPTGIDLSMFHPAHIDKKLVATLRSKYKINNQQKIIAYIGRLAPEKDIDMAIEGFAKIQNPDIVMMIVGGGPSLQDLMQKAQTLGIASRVIFTDKQPREYMPAFYAMANVFVSPSLSETQGLTFLEALASGLPVFARRDAVVEELVYEAKSGYYFDDAQMFSQKAEIFFALSQTQQKKMNMQCFEIVKKYDVEHFYEGVMCAYVDAIEAYHENYRVVSIRTSDEWMKLLVCNQKTKKEDSLFISLEDYTSMGIKKDGILENSDYEVLKEKEKRLLAYRKCIRKLRGKDYTKKEMYDILKKEDVSKEGKEAIIEDLEKKGFIDDEAYLTLQIEKMNHALFGKQKIKQKLLAKGISEEAIQEKMLTMQEDLELHKARVLGHKYYDSIQNKSLKEKKLCIERKLYRDGFHMEVIHEVLEEINFEEDILKEHVHLSIHLEKAYKTYGRKFAGKDLEERLLRALMRKGFMYDDIKVAIEMRNEDEQND
ncbi:MAG: glycosyltransferase [Breznakia sp.]